MSSYPDDDYSPEAIRADLWTDPRSGERLPGAPPIRQAIQGDADERLPPPPRPTPGQIERDVRAAVVHAAVRFCHEAPVDAVRALAHRLRPSPIACVYVAGPYSGADGWEVACNVHRAEEVAREVVRLGAAPVTPHSIGARMAGTETYELWCETTLEMMRRCDAVVFVPGWERSRGAVGERKEAVRIGLPCFDRILDLRVWLEGRRA